MKCVALLTLLVSSASALNVKIDHDREHFGIIRPSRSMTNHEGGGKTSRVVWARISKKRATNVQALTNAPEKQSIIFYGDSIVEHLSGEKGGKWTVGEGGKKEMWMQMGDRYGPALASGIGGDLIVDLHYRLQHGEGPADAKPKVIMVHIGTNDLGHELKGKGHVNASDTAKKIFVNYENLVEELTHASPDSAIVLTAIFPRSEQWPKGPFGEVIPELNKMIASLAHEPSKIYYSDCSSALLSKDGRVTKEFFEDSLHPNLYGVMSWMECLKPTLDKILPVRQVPTLLPPEKKESWAKILSGGVGHASESYTAAGDKGTAKEAAPSGPLTKGDMSDLFAGVMKKFETDLKS